MKKRVLVAEDNEFVRRLLVTLLAGRNCDVTAFADGRSAVEALYSRDVTFDAVVTDFQMPGANGLDVMRAALAAGITAMGLQSSGLGTDAGLMRHVTDFVREISDLHPQGVRFATLPKPYLTEEFDAFVERLGLST